MIFYFTDDELDALKRKDKRLARAIEKIGRIEREGDEDIFSAVIHHIIAQQISTKAQASIWARFKALFRTLNAKSVFKAGAEKIRSCGISQRKAEYILDFANKVQSGEFKAQELAKMSDEEAIKELVKLRGIGVWTAEMILLFCMQRKDILSYDDLALQRGLKMLYGLDLEAKISKDEFNKYKKKFSPYASIASLYLWELASGGGQDLGHKMSS